VDTLVDGEHVFISFDDKGFITGAWRHDWRQHDQ
jgi:hypothetical protein